MKCLPPTFSLAVIVIFIGMICGCATAPRNFPPAATEKIALRNNTASLLYDLLNNEKNVSKILIIKHDSAPLHGLIKAISATTGNAADRMTELAKADPTLNLHDLGLPAGEKAARAAVTKTTEHDLLFTSGNEFQFNLLLTQAQALSYGSHLAKVAAENSSQPDAIKAFQSFDVAMNDLYLQVVTMMRTTPAN
jgi:hypothetical protein